ncbi:hypothetical protein PR048_022644 [Dryococelus australis]|uniref:Innexin n=1 Tax=Dryococelus australis TaxID=614101 RepID=A0ABQ9H1L2_9NEOP|nr:hypothetical protein PR048_022644 [Dryococelus australis]
MYTPPSDVSQVMYTPPSDVSQVMYTPPSDFSQHILSAASPPEGVCHGARADGACTVPRRLQRDAPRPVSSALRWTSTVIETWTVVETADGCHISDPLSTREVRREVEARRPRAGTHPRRRSTVMLDIFRGLKNLIKVSHIHIDSPIFRLHYSVTVLILISFSLIVTTRQYVGNPIDCIHTKDIPEDVLNTFCWIHSTYTMRSAFRKKVGVEIPYQGVDNSKGQLDDRKCYKYYQWVCFCLFFQRLRPGVMYMSILVGFRCRLEQMSKAGVCAGRKWLSLEGAARSRMRRADEGAMTWEDAVWLAGTVSVAQLSAGYVISPPVRHSSPPPKLGTTAPGAS